MARKIRTIALLLIAAAVLSSCSILFGSFGGNTATSYYANVTTDESLYVYNPELGISVNRYDVFCLGVDYSEDNPFYRVVTYDPDEVILLTHDYSSINEEELAANDFAEDEEVNVAVVTGSDPIYFVPCADESASTTVTVEPVSDDFSRNYEKFGFTVNITVPETVEMADTASTRLYGLDFSGSLINETLDGVELRGVRYFSTNRVEVRYSSMTASLHDYVATVTSEGAYPNDQVKVFFNSEMTEATHKYSTSSSSYSLSFYVTLSPDLESEAYKNKEDLTLRLNIYDKTDGVAYTDTFSIPITTLDDSMSEITGFAASTNGVAGAPAMVDTRVAVDASFEAFSEFDRFRTVRMVVRDPNSEDVMDHRGSVWPNGSATVGTAAGGWGETELFADGKYFASFIPKEAGTYKVNVYGYDDDGYNFCAKTFEFEVVR